MSEKGRKLRRYSRKDYSQLVDFPVEIVGRDGVVRRYSFEASIRLYQRRIASAGARYEDQDLASAEVEHCRRRIEQLRKSYFQRYGWAALRRDAGRAILPSGPMAGELTAFVRRFYGSEVDPQLIDLQGVEGSAPPCWYVHRAGDPHGYLLYLHRFDDDSAGREHFFDQLRHLRGAVGPDVERLVAFHHTADCGLVLSGTGAAAAHPPELDEDDGEEEDPFGIFGEGEDAYGDGIRLLAEGEPESALARFEAALERSPQRRPAAIAACVVADMLGRPANAEAAARLGAQYHPSDATFAYHLGLARLRQFDGAEAATHLARSVSLRPDLWAPQVLLALTELAGGHWRAGLRRLALADRLQRAEEADGRDLVQRVRIVVRSCQAALALGALASLLGGLTLAGLTPGSESAALLGIFGLPFAVLGGRGLMGRLLGPEALARVRLPPPGGLAGCGLRLDDALG